MGDGSKQALGRLLDPAALDASKGPRAKLRIEAPPEWLAAGGELEVPAPARLVCARCDGGGCDGCNRSGALAAPADPDARTIHATLPPDSDGGVALRLLHPFGDGGIEQLILEVRPGPPARGLTRRPSAPVALARPKSDPRARAALGLMIAALAVAVTLALTVR
jgi:hypothetical protein